MKSAKRDKNDRVLSIRNLCVSIDTIHGEMNILRNMKLDLYKGETVALIGESGSGKSMTCKAVMGLLPPKARITSGEIIYTYEENGQKKQVDLTKLDAKTLRNDYLGNHIAMVFQNPMTSLDPTMTIGKQLIEALPDEKKKDKASAKNNAIALLTEVGLSNPEKQFAQYPHELSGGMKQRVVIAIAIASEPDILICDEPTTALDVTIQAKILELIKNIQIKRNISIIFITHNLGVVAKNAEYVAIMYAGRVIEKGSVEEIFFDPRHPYTWGLMTSMPDVNIETDRLLTIPGNPFDLSEKVVGDPFAPRNAYAVDKDYIEEPPMFSVGGWHRVASWLYEDENAVVKRPEKLLERLERMKKEGIEYEG